MKERIVVRNPEDCLQVLEKFWKKRQEHFVVITLDGSHAIIKTHVVTIGLANRTLIHPREIFYPAIKDNAVSIIIAHNHPSGNLTPSQEDINVTERIKKSAEILGIVLLDHLIVGGFYRPDVYSIMNDGRL